MDYELCKKLKDAGFPQEGLFYFKKKRAAGNNTWKYVRTYSGGELFSDIEEGCIDPTLPELIAACGEKFYKLRRMIRGWTATGDLAEEWGLTPEEAVARLWLALHPNK